MKLVSKLFAYSFSLLFFSTVFLVGVAFAQEDPSGQPSTLQFVMGTVQFIGIGFFVYYLLVLLPRNTAETEHKKFLSNLKKGDEVVTSGGLLGKVSQVKEEAITIELASSVKIRVLPKHVRTRSSGKEPETVATKKKAANNK